MHFFENLEKFLNVIFVKNPASKVVYNEIKIKTKLYYIYLLVLRGQQKSRICPTNMYWALCI